MSVGSFRPYDGYSRMTPTPPTPPPPPPPPTSDMVGHPYSFLDEEASQERPNKIDLKVRVCQDLESDTSCGDTRYHENDFGFGLRDQDTYYEELSHKVAVLETKLAAEIRARQQQNVLMSMNEKRASKRLADKCEEIELLKVGKQNVEAECKMLKERLEVTSKHLNAVEALFSDVNEKYEKSKETIQILSHNVDILKKSAAEHEEGMRQKHEQFLKLKEHAIEKLNYANVQLDLIQKRHFTENSKLRTALEKAESKARLLTEQLECKTKENVDLINICDSLLKNLDSMSDCSFEKLVTAIWKDQQEKNVIF